MITICAAFSACASASASISPLPQTLPLPQPQTLPLPQPQTLPLSDLGPRAAISGANGSKITERHSQTAILVRKAPYVAPNAPRSLSGTRDLRSWYGNGQSGAERSKIMRGRCLRVILVREPPYVARSAPRSLRGRARRRTTRGAVPNWSALSAEHSHPNLTGGISVRTGHTRPPGAVVLDSGRVAGHSESATHLCPGAAKPHG